MVFLSGPRQAGKTTCAQEFLKKYQQGDYTNWDNIDNQKTIAKTPYFFASKPRLPNQPYLVVFDEIHKYSRWKNYIKGAYDTYHHEFDFLVTGSGHLDIYKKGGDSLLGRYFSVPLFPLSVGEILKKLPTFKESIAALQNPKKATREASGAYDQLNKFSGYPDPFLKSSEDFYNLWGMERKQRLLREDVRYFIQVRELSQLEILSHLLPERVGSPLSINALREDIGVAFETVRDWIGYLEYLYYCFRIYPYSLKIQRSLKKEAKLYLYDWAEIQTPSIRFENMVALHLLKAVKMWGAQGQTGLELKYLRDKEKREVDFVIVNKKPAMLIECKYSDDKLSPNLVLFQKQLDVPLAFQVIHSPATLKYFKEGKYVQWVVSADIFLSCLP